MKITPPCPKPAAQEASRMVGVKKFNLWVPWKSMEMSWSSSTVPQWTIFYGLRKAKREKSPWGLSVGLSFTGPARALLQNLLCARAISIYCGGVATGGGSLTNLHPSGWIDAGWWNTRARRERGDISPSKRFCVHIEYHLENHIPDLLRTPASSIYTA